MSSSDTMNIIVQFIFTQIQLDDLKTTDQETRNFNTNCKAVET
jgi:hypothetical protein